MIFVTKADGTRQPFDESKVVRTCLRMHATQEQAKSVADKIKKKIYDGIPTRKILQLIFDYMEKYKPEIRHRLDLREAISLLRPKPDFEQFVALVLKELGYKVLTNQIIRGRCVEHEIDAVAIKDDEVVYVEVKHHFQPHTYTGVGVCLETQATLEDLIEGFNLNTHTINFNRAMLVCNTKFSDHAIQYATCKGIKFIGWRAPFDGGLEKIIDERKLYPITLLRDLDRKTRERLVDNGVVLLKQLVECDLNELWKKTGIPKNRLEDLIDRAKQLIGGQI
jgi:Holliday junction resolvase-like predicted endonuclease